MDEEMLVQWIQEKYGIPPSEIRNQGRYFVSYSWRKDQTYGFAYFYDGHLRLIKLENVENTPTFEQGVANLGPPEAVYRHATRVEDTVYLIQLEYPRLGFSVGARGVMRGYATAVTLSECMRVSEVSCYVPGSLEEVQKALNYPGSIIGDPWETLIPWPGFGASLPLDSDSEP